MTSSNGIEVTVETEYLESRSAPEDEHYVFAYTVTIRNHGPRAAQLLTRHWIITDGDGNVQEVRGDGVIGEQPHIPPGQGFRYTSGASIETPAGTMHGSYGMRGEDGTEFDAEIPVFALRVPGAVH